MDLIIQIALFFLLGVLVYYADGVMGTGLYRLWYNMTHKDPLSSGVTLGFLHNRSARVRLIWALTITVIVTAVSMIFGNFFSETTRVLLNLLALLVGVSAGFLVAPIVLKRVPGQVSKVIDYADQAEKGDSPFAGPGHSEPKPKSRPEATVSENAPAKQSLPVPESRTPDRSLSPESPATPSPDKPEIPDAGSDWRKGVEEFLKK